MTQKTVTKVNTNHYKMVECHFNGFQIVMVESMADTDISVE